MRRRFALVEDMCFVSLHHRRDDDLIVTRGALAIESRPDLHAQLAAIRRDRLNVNLARLQYYPDLTFKAGWGDMSTYKALAPEADGMGMLGVGIGANIPIYRKRLEAGVREAEAKTLASAREYDAMRDKAQEEVKDLFVQLTSQEQLLTLFRTDIIPKAEQTLKVSTSAYQTGKIDILMLIDNRKQLLQYRIGQQRLEAQLRQTLASLERAVGGVLTAASSASPESLPTPNEARPLVGRHVISHRTSDVSPFLNSSA